MDYGGGLASCLGTYGAKGDIRISGCDDCAYYAADWAAEEYSAQRIDL